MNFDKPYIIKNKNGMEVTLLRYGARVHSITIPDSNGNITDVTLGYEDLSDYYEDSYCFGATIGRNANRMRGAAFALNNRKYQLTKDADGNNCHSGPDGYHNRFWEVGKYSQSQITFTLFSPDGDQGFPGNFRVKVIYTVTEQNELVIDFRGKSDQDTLINMTNHCYFNLNGHTSGDVYDQLLKIHARYYSPVDAFSIPIGRDQSVADTPFDFTRKTAIGKSIKAGLKPLQQDRGYNHNFILDGEDGIIRLAAEAESVKTGICLAMYTDLPSLQLYTGGYIEDVTGKGGKKYEKGAGFCLEAQFTPNIMNEQSGLKPFFSQKEEYQKTIIYKLFSH